MRCLTVFSFILIYQNINAQEPLHDKVFFANSLMTKNYYYSEVSYTAPSWLKNDNKKIPVTSSIFFTPGNALELHYTSADKGQWEAKIFYNTGRGVDFFIPATHLSFRLYIQSPETAPGELPQVGVGNRKTGERSFVSLQNVIKNFHHRQWLTIEIPLNNFEGSDSSKWKNLDVVAFSLPTPFLSGFPERAGWISAWQWLPNG